MEEKKTNAPKKDAALEASEAQAPEGETAEVSDEKMDEVSGGAHYYPTPVWEMDPYR